MLSLSHATQRMQKCQYPTRSSGASLQLKEIDGDWRALRRPRSIIKIIEVTAEALIENIRATEGQRTVTASGEASGVDCSILGRGIKLELEVGSNVACTSLSVLEDAISEGDGESAFAFARHHGDATVC